MPLTLEEITAREEDLRQEIAEREHLVAAYQLIRADLEKARPAACDAVAAREPEPEARPEPEAPRVLPAAPVHVLPQVNLQALSQGYGGGIRLVTWAIRQMPGDFTVRDLAAALRQAGCPMRIAKISVVLNRMEDEGKIEEVTKGRGRTPSLFRATARAIAVPLELAARHRTPRRAVWYRVSR